MVTFACLANFSPVYAIEWLGRAAANPMSARPRALTSNVVIKVLLLKRGLEIKEATSRRSRLALTKAYCRNASRGAHSDYSDP